MAFGSSAKWPRWKLAHRLTATLVGTAFVSMLLVLLVHDRALRLGLRGNAEARVAGAARAAERLIEDHLREVEARYLAISATPQIRATLELRHARTTQFLAERLRTQQGAAGIAIVDSGGAVLAQSGARVLARDPGQPELARAQGNLYAAAPIRVDVTRTRHVTLQVLESVGDELIQDWSERCGAQLLWKEDSTRPDATLVSAVVAAGNLAGLRVVSDLGPELAALRAARGKLALAGLAALGVTLVVCAALARGLVAPIQRIQRALAQIGGGDLSVRLMSRRSDEIGEMARGVDRMAERLLASHDQLADRLSELRKSQAHLTRAQQIARLGSFELDLDTGELLGSEEFWVLFAAPDPSKGLLPQELLERLHADERRAIFDAVRGCSEGAVGAQVDFRVRLPDASERFLQAQFQLARASQAEPGRRLHGTVQDLTERRRSEAQIQYLAYHDSLTGLANRSLFGERVGLAMSQARRSGTKLGILYLDLDDFKRVNDTLGHDVGDDVLRQVADRLVQGTREAEIASRGVDFEPAVCRHGGDEFSILVTDVREPSSLALIAEHLLHALQRPYRLVKDEVVISASIGISTWPDDGDRFETLLGNADAAMYQAKASGRNAIRFYDAAMNEAAMRRLTVEVRLRAALERGELDLAFQPKLDLATGQTVGFEALARWSDPELGAVSPAEFVLAAEQTGLIAPLGRWVLDRVCRELAERQDLLRRAGVTVSFNVSAREFGRRFAQEISDVIAEHGVDPRLLQIEITETAVMRDERAVISALYAVRELGLSIALDDFGTGFSSLAYLQKLPVDTLKMDRSFIQSITEDADAAELARSIVAMGNALGLYVVAEGVEQEAQRSLLAEWGCHAAQGFLIGKPVPASEAFASLQDVSPPSALTRPRRRARDPGGRTRPRRA